MDELAAFDPKMRIIEYMLEDSANTPLINMTLTDFAEETASESMAPGGGSISAYVGSLGASLASMVANLSSHKKGWDSRWEEFSNWAEKAQNYKNRLLLMVDEDTKSFNAIIDAMRLPKATDEEKTARTEAIQTATKYAVEVPLKVMEITCESFDVIKAMVEIGNPNSVTDAGVGALCARAAVNGAYLNVKVNISSLKDKSYVSETLAKADDIVRFANEKEAEILKMVNEKMAVM